MRPLRPVDFDAFDRSRYHAQTLWHGESCVLIGSNVPAGMPAFGHHRHEHSDQLYYIVHGEMQVQLGTEHLAAGPGSLVYIPMGTPHHNWNEGDIDEFHLEVLAPAPLPTQPLATPTDATEAAGRPYFVRRLDESAFVAAREFPGFSLNRIMQGPDSPGSSHVSLYVGQVEPGSGGPGLHIHAFDQFYFVLSGRLHVQVGLEGYVASTGTLVVLPAGVPHRQWNEGPEIERHIALLVPTPEPGQPLDVGVSLSATGAAY